MMPAAAAAAAPRTRTGCTSCRVRHLKCDEARPVCRRCQRAHRECVRGYNVRFRYSTNIHVLGSTNNKATTGQGTSKAEYNFSHRQVWVQTPRVLSFVDETQDLLLSNDYDNNEDEDDGVIPLSEPPPPCSPTSVSTTTAPPHYNGPYPFSPPVLSSQSPAQQQQPSPGLGVTHSHSENSGRHVHRPHRRRRQHSVVVGGGRGRSEVATTSDTYSHEYEHEEHEELELHAAAAAADDDDVVDVVNVAADDEFLPLPPPAPSTGPPLPLEILSSIHLEHPIWPLQDVKQAALLRHFIQNLASWFDVNDHQKHFTTIVPNYAGTCPMLLYAIFALASRHLSRISDYDPYAANHYHQECLKIYIPALDCEAAIRDEVMLAATVILRVFEELDAPITGKDTQSHLLGTSILASISPSSPHSGGLRQASFWVHLRQDIYISFVNQRPIKTDLAHFGLLCSSRDWWTELSSASCCGVGGREGSDDAWANRMVCICAEILDVVFGGGEAGGAGGGGGEGKTSRERWEELKDAVTEWELRRPKGFECLYWRDRCPGEGGGFWPEMWFVGDCHVTAAQYTHLSHLLLSIYNPTLPRMGPSFKTSSEALAALVVRHVRALCGIAGSNTVVPGRFTACHAICACGGWFEDRNEQEALMELLRATEREYAWPTAGAQKGLMEQWGWEVVGEGV